MLFTSYPFLIFFVVVTAIYFVLPHRFRWAWLLASSCVFYMWFIPLYILILFATIVIDYFAGLLIARSTGSRRKTYLVVSIVATCLVLAVFKYLGFLSETITAIAQALGLDYPNKVLSIVLPLGLSFHTFQGLAYVIEVYRGRQQVERHPGIFALYVMFYPQLVAGPIERPQNMLHQFREVHRFDGARVADGLKLMLWGFFKKLVIADRLAVFVDQVYGNVDGNSGLVLCVATVFFAIQIYCDFSAYSDIAIGAAQVMGFRLMTNFDRPYHSASIAEFWTRWHISLSTWFRDFLYIPLGGNRVAKWRWQFNLFVTFVVSGLWHGADWTFVIWGALNGFYLLFALWTRRGRDWLARVTRLDSHPTVRRVFGVVAVFLLITFAWIFFRADSLADAWYVVTHLFSGWGAGLSELNASLEAVSWGMSVMAALLIAIGFMEFVHWWQRSGDVRHLFAGASLPIRWAVWYGLILGILIAGVFANDQFIYFQF